MPEVIKRHALLFTVVLGGVVLLVLVVLMRQKSAAANAANSASGQGAGSAGDSGLTSGYAPSFSESITNIYGSGAGDAGSSGTTSGGGSSSSGGLTGPIPPVAPPPASGANTVTTNAVYAGSAGRLPPEPAHNPVRLFRTPPVSA